MIALVAFACGAIIGFKVPVACRINLVTPRDPIMARALRDLLAQAKVAIGSETATRDWVFAPNGDLDGITPAEAMQYKARATGVGRLLEAEAVRRREEVRSERPTPVVIEGGRSAGGLPGSPDRRSEGFHSSESAQHPAFYAGRGSTPARAASIPSQRSDSKRSPTRNPKCNTRAALGDAQRIPAQQRSRAIWSCRSSPPAFPD